MKNGGAVRVIVSGNESEAKLAFEYVSSVVKPKPEKSVLEAKASTVRTKKSATKTLKSPGKQSKSSKVKDTKKNPVRTVPKIRLD